MIGIDAKALPNRTTIAHNIRWHAQFLACRPLRTVPKVGRNRRLANRYGSSARVPDFTADSSAHLVKNITRLCEVFSSAPRSALPPILKVSARDVCGLFFPDQDL